MGADRKNSQERSTLPTGSPCLIRRQIIPFLFFIFLVREQEIVTDAVLNEYIAPSSGFLEALRTVATPRS